MEDNNIDVVRTALIEDFVRDWAPSKDDIQEKMKLDLGKLLDVYKNDGTDPKYLNIPNICFSLTKPDDDREPAFREQRIKRGFDDSETWSLRDTITGFILPRLKLHREIIDGFIGDTNGLYEKIDLSIRAFEIVKKEDETGGVTKEEWEEFDKGMTAFGDVFMRLWW